MASLDLRLGSAPGVPIGLPGEIPAPLRSLMAAREVLIAVGIGIVLQLAVVALPLLHEVFDTTSLTVAGWLLCLSAALVAPIGILLASQFAHPDPRRSR